MSTASNRSRSPQKRLGDTKLTSVPIDFLPLTDQVVPKELRSLYIGLRDISDGVGILPCQTKGAFEELGIYIPKHQWDDGEVTTAKVAQLTFDRAHFIWSRAMRCSQRGVAESRWNAEVHSQLLCLALDEHPETSGVSYEDITSARITDKSLLATIGTLTSQAKLVDYGIIIDDAALQQRVIAKLKEPASFSPSTAVSFNCVTADYVRFDPIAISIETKKEDPTTRNPSLQLGIWMTAHFLKLRQLAYPNEVALPMVPALIVEGHAWKMVLVCLVQDQTGGSRLSIFSHMSLGDTTTLPGVFRVVTALRRLALWVHIDYRPWLEKNIIRAD